jgi:hypothetical protein
MHRGHPIAPSVPIKMIRYYPYPNNLPQKCKKFVLFLDLEYNNTREAFTRLHNLHTTHDVHSSLNVVVDRRNQIEFDG